VYQKALKPELLNPDLATSNPVLEKWILRLWSAEMSQVHFIVYLVIRNLVDKLIFRTQFVCVCEL